jgi:hypothetical protein
MTSQSPLIEDMLEGQQRHQQMSIAEKFKQTTTTIPAPLLE